MSEKSSTGTAVASNEVGWADLARIGRRRWRIGAALTSAITIATAVVAMTLPDQYGARVTVLPLDSGSRLPGVLGSFGSFGGLLDDQRNVNEQFFGQIAESDTVLNRLVDRDWLLDGDRRKLHEVLDIEWGSAPDDSLDNMYELKRTLRESVISFDRDPISGFMTLTCSFNEHPALAARFANALVQEIDVFTLRMNQREARAQRQFIEGRLSEVESRMVQSEEDLTDFLSANQTYRSAPGLMQEYRSLSRIADANRTMWIELKRQYEVARIDESRNMASIRILDRATPPQRPTGPNRILIVGLGFFFGLVAASGLVIAPAFFRS